MAKNSPPLFERSTPASRPVLKIAMTLAGRKKALKVSLADVRMEIAAFYKRKNFGTNKLQNNAKWAVNNSYFLIVTFQLD